MKLIHKYIKRIYFAVVAFYCNTTFIAITLSMRNNNSWNFVTIHFFFFFPFAKNSRTFFAFTKTQSFIINVAMEEIYILNKKSISPLRLYCKIIFPVITQLMHKNNFRYFLTKFFIRYHEPLSHMGLHNRSEVHVLINENAF